ncbi:MAG: DUF3857 domain-containing protein [Psychroserpens sp.]|nr:DUF3857 domain-containing protein [Psychroserpens sp.]
MQSILIPSELQKNANAVVRSDATNIQIFDIDRMVITNKRIITIFNSSADSKLGAFVYYDKGTNIKKLEARVYNSVGEEIKKIRQRDFVDQSAVSGGTLYSDTRVKYLDYTPVSYPYTMHLETEVEYSTTAFIPSWTPIEGFHTSTQNSSYKIENLTSIPLKVKPMNFEDFNIEKLGEVHYAVKNLKALKYESYSPSFEKFAPKLKVSMEEFMMEGVAGSNSNWNDFGKWMNDKLIAGTQDLPDAVINEVIALTKDAESDIEKAKIVYQYMQGKTRYISVQVGIGGWKPMLASDVERLGYGDCKGLTNYTKAMLDEIGVPNYYTVI